MGMLRRILDVFSASSSGTSTLTGNAGWLAGLDYHGWATSSGEPVTADTAMTLPVYFRCAVNLSEDIAKLPLLLYRRLDRGKDRAPEHPVYRLIHDSPSPIMSAFSFRETMQFYAATWGNGLAEIERDGAGRPLALWLIHPSRVEMRRDTNRAWYYAVRVSDIDGGSTNVVRLELDDVFHLHGLGLNALWGVSIFRLAAESLGLGLAAQRFGAAFFGNGAAAAGILSHPQTLKPDARKHLRESWEKMHSGAGNVGRTAILEEGVKYEKIMIPPEEAQYLQTRQFQIEEIARWFRMPPQKVGHLERAQGWSTLEAMNRDYSTDTLLPWTTRWEQEIQRKLLNDLEREQYFAEHLFLGLLRADSKERGEFYTKQLANGAMSPNDIREAENMNPLPDGDIYLVPMNMQSLSQAARPAPASQPPPPPVTEGQASGQTAAARVQGLAPVIQDVAGRCARRAARACADARKRPDFTAWLSGFKQDHRRYILEAFGSLFQSFGVELSAAGAGISRHLESLDKVGGESAAAAALGRAMTDALISDLAVRVPAAEAPSAAAADIAALRAEIVEFSERQPSVNVNFGPQTRRAVTRTIERDERNFITRIRETEDDTISVDAAAKIEPQPKVETRIERDGRKRIVKVVEVEK